MKTKELPAIIMLVAGFIDCIFAIYQHQSLMDFTRQLLLVLVIFYIMGCVVKIVIDINFKPMAEDAQGAAESGETPGDGVMEEHAADASQTEGLEKVQENLEDIQSGTE